MQQQRRRTIPLQHSSLNVQSLDTGKDRNHMEKNMGEKSEFAFYVDLFCYYINKMGSKPHSHS